MKGSVISMGSSVVRLLVHDTHTFIFLTIDLEKEIEIVYDLAQRVLQYENVLIETSDICGEMDRFVIQEM